MLRTHLVSAPAHDAGLRGSGVEGTARIEGQRGGLADAATGVFLGSGLGFRTPGFGLSVLGLGCRSGAFTSGGPTA